ncbi:DUF4271 domain-containing protein [Maribacter sp. MMG018]|uniref:DUF4271 domain-containing protein n=1 Tax=Maribacter sp. MMG018 TaxID=2822688 RepID=UPI001B371C02|nr:DUF4271 domain-containing protein [Maribacter sp. MMG018]MBQ4913049.1 DUF4271 domain-containing protein [Maribacter sp. MMG018]
MEPITRITENADWITLIIFGSLLLLIAAKTLFYSRFLNFMILPFNNKYILMYNKKEKLFNWFHILLTIFQIINTSMFIFLSWKAYIKPETKDPEFIFLIILAAIFLFLVLKISLQLINGFIFDAYNLTNEFVFKKISYLNYGSLVLFIANILLSFVFKDSLILVYIAATLFLIINIIGWITVIKVHQKFIASYFFYFILYLCTLEIAPLIIMGSFLK